MARIVYSFLLLAVALTATAATPATSGTLQPVLIVFDEDVRHIDLVLKTRALIRNTGGHVRAVVGLAAIVADAAPETIAEIGTGAGVHVHDSRVAIPATANPETAAAMIAWNRLREPRSKARSSSAPPPELLMNDVVENPAGLRLRMLGLDQQSASTRRATLPWRLQRSASIGCGSNAASYFDTSLYLAGDFAVGVFYVPSQNPWDASLTASTFADVVAALDAFIDMEPEARLTFTYINEVDSSGNALPKPGNEYSYVNDLRSTYCTDWSFLIAMSNGGVWPNANLHGPSLRMDRTFGWFHDVLRHEVTHIVGAGDAYAPAPPNSRWGYLQGTNGNACGQGGGYFSGQGECLADLENGWDPIYGYNSRISPSTAAELGWLAPGGEGILEVLDTQPVIDASSVVHVVNPATSAITYHGVATDRPRLNDENPGSDVSVNRIKAVQYSVNLGPWQDASAADGVFDSSSEDFDFTIPPLPVGTYTIEIQAINTIGAISPVPFTTQLVLATSTVIGSRPFAALAIAPERAMIGTTITATGQGSRDLQPGALEYSWNWGTGWTPFSTTPLATHVYTTPGTYPVQLRVRDHDQQIHLVSKDVTIEANDTAPTPKFRVAYENQHGTGPAYVLYLSAVGSHDAETPFGQLKVQWDIDCDGWDAPPALQKAKAVTLTNPNYPKSDRRCIRMRVFDAANNSSAVLTQHVWVVPYNHPPVINNVTFAPNGADFTMTVSATDPDSATTWDGILEYRYDFDGDGIWDTPFQSAWSQIVSAADRYTVRVEVRDRFNARATWVLDCYPLAC